MQNSDITYATQKEKLLQIEETVSKLEAKYEKLKQNKENAVAEKNRFIQEKLDANLEI